MPIESTTQAAMNSSFRFRNPSRSALAAAAIAAFFVILASASPAPLSNFFTGTIVLDGDISDFFDPAGPTLRPGACLEDDASGLTDNPISPLTTLDGEHHPSGLNQRRIITAYNPTLNNGTVFVGVDLAGGSGAPSSSKIVHASPGNPNPNFADGIVGPGGITGLSIRPFDADGNGNPETIGLSGAIPVKRCTDPGAALASDVVDCAKQESFGFTDTVVAGVDVGNKERYQVSIVFGGSILAQAELFMDNTTPTNRAGLSISSFPAGLPFGVAASVSGGVVLGFDVEFAITNVNAAVPDPCARVVQTITVNSGSLQDGVPNGEDFGRVDCVYSVPCVDVTKLIACVMPGGSCGVFTKTATGVRMDETEIPAFCYSITVSNCGCVTLTNNTVVDNVLGDLTSLFFASSTTPLAPGASITRIIGPIGIPTNTVNTVVAMGTDITTGRIVTDSDFAEAFIREASVICTGIATSPADVDGRPRDLRVQLPGDGSPHPVTFSVTVCNDGATDLTNVTVTASGCAGPFPAPFTLAVGACRDVELCTLTFTCPVRFTNTITVTAEADGHGTNCVTDVAGTPISTMHVCEAFVECDMGACRMTGGGKQYDRDGTNIAVLGASTFPKVRYVTHGGQIGAPVGNETLFDPDTPCIQGNWEHVRHIQGGTLGNFHAKSFDSLLCACLSCPEDPNSGVVVGALCNPGMRTCGPEPRKAPANKICFSGVGDYALTSGNRAARSVVFRVDIEDRSEPGGKPGELPPDRYRFRMWFITGDPYSTENLNLRKAVAASPISVSTKDGANVPLGQAAFGVRAPDIDDGGQIDQGNHQIHPSIKDCP